jgi:N-acetylmuramoyl-L-alanine amidase
MIIKESLIDIFGNLNDKQLIALAIYGEARGESMQGKIAVGSVILERVDKKGWMGKTIQEVCLKPYQFSCFLPNDPNFPALKLIAENWNEKYKNSLSLQQCYNVSRGLIDGLIQRTPEIVQHHITQYKTVNCKASWADKMKLIMTIGNHQFYG